MDYFDEFASAGKKINDAVNRAVDQNDYSSLSCDITEQIRDLSKEIQKYNQEKFQKMTGGPAQESSTSNRESRPTGRPAASADRRISGPFQQVHPSYVRSGFKRIFGGIGIVLFVIVMLAGIDPLNISVLLSGIIGTAAFCWLLRSGRQERRLIDTFYRYSRWIGNAEYITIEDLAELSGESGETVIANLENMMQRGLLPRGRLDKEKSTLMLTDKIYQQYIMASRKAAERNEEISRKNEQMSARDSKINGMAVSDAVKDILKNGQSYVDRIQKYNNEIPDEEFSEKLDRLKLTVDRIFTQVRKNPASAGDMSKFMNYYLPTTDKLIRAYIDLDQQPADSANIAETKKEIVASMDTIIEAFDSIFESMFQSVAWDISSDISAMKSMMAQDGLAEDHTGAKA